MNREIKFRAWDKEYNEMQKVRDIYFDTKTGELEYFISKGTFATHNGTIETHKLMQYTGLKDKNDVEIYEGDIVRVTLRNYETFVSSVKWFGDEGYPAFDLHQVNEVFYFNSNILSTVMNDCSKVEVIGNIYENPELL